MKRKKIAKEFHFSDMEKEEFNRLLGEEFPINIKKLEFIIDNIYDKYPVIDKSQISIIVRTVFESIRDFLLLGYIMNFNKFIFDMKMNFFLHKIYDKFYPALRVKLKTPPKLRGSNDL